MSHYLHSKEKISRSVLMFWHGMGFSCLKMYSTQYTTNTPRIYCYVPSRGSFTFPVYMASCGLRKNVHVFEIIGECFEYLTIIFFQNRKLIVNRIMLNLSLLIEMKELLAFIWSRYIFCNIFVVFSCHS